MNIKPKKLWEYLDKVVKVTSSVLSKIPQTTDTKVGAALKWFSIANDIKQNFFSKNTPSIQEYCETHDLVRKDGEPWISLYKANLLFSKQEKELFTIKTNEVRAHRILLDNDKQVIMLCNYYYPEQIYDSYIYMSKDIDYQKYFNEIWKTYGHGIYMDFSENIFQFSSVVETIPELSPRALERIKVYDYLTSGAILLKGVPGTGKTSFAFELARQRGHLLKISHVALDVASLKSLTELIDSLDISVILLDDFDRTNKDDSAKYFDFIEALKDKNKIICITVNDIYCLDYALLRTGRISAVIDFDLPDEQERKWFIEKIPNVPTEKIKSLVSRTKTFTQSDFISLIQKSGIISIEQSFKEIEKIKETFDSALEVYQTRSENKPSKNSVKKRRKYKAYEMPDSIVESEE